MIALPKRKLWLPFARIRDGDGKRMRLNTGARLNTPSAPECCCGGGGGAECCCESGTITSAEVTTAGFTTSANDCSHAAFGQTRDCSTLNGTWSLPADLQSNSLFDCNVASDDELDTWNPDRTSPTGEFVCDPYYPGGGADSTFVILELVSFQVTPGSPCIIEASLHTTYYGQGTFVWGALGGCVYNFRKTLTGDEQIDCDGGVYVLNYLSTSCSSTSAKCDASSATATITFSNS